MRSKFFNSNHSKAFTLVELMVVVMIIGILASIGVSGFQSYILRSKTAEAPMGISKMVTGEIDYFAKNNAFLAAGPANFPPTSNKNQINFAADPNWASLSFSFADAVLFAYQADLVAAGEVDCKAMGDLNGDGNTSLFQRNVTLNASNQPVVTELFILDELE